MLISDLWAFAELAGPVWGLSLRGVVDCGVGMCFVTDGTGGCGRGMGRE
jgi:hypothetical protein